MARSYPIQLSEPSSPSAEQSGSLSSASSSSSQDSSRRSDDKPVQKAIGKEVKFVSFDQAAGFTVKGRMTLPNVSHSTVMDVLTDWEACPRVFQNIEKCSVETLPSGDKKVSQTCRWRFAWMSGTFDCIYQVTEQRDTPKPGDGHVQFNLVESSFMRSFQGRWHVQAWPSASSNNNNDASEGCYMEHTMSVKPSMRMGPFAKFARGIFTAQVQGIFDDLEAEATKRTAAERSASFGSG